MVLQGDTIGFGEASKLQGSKQVSFVDSEPQRKCFAHACLVSPDAGVSQSPFTTLKS